MFSCYVDLFVEIVLRWGPVIVVYDTGVLTKEEDDPATAVLYYRPRTTPTTARSALAGQLAGVVHFCRAAFTTPKVIATRLAHIAIKDYGRFVFMVCGRDGDWVSSRLESVSRLLDAATGGLSELYISCGRDQNNFVNKLTSLLDSIVPSAIPDANFKDGASGLSSSSSPISNISLSSEITDDINPEESTSRIGADADYARETTSSDEQSKSEEEIIEENLLDELHQAFDAVPSVPLPKSGGGVFLRAQQVVEACQQQPGVLAGITSFRNRILSTQVQPDLGHVISAVSSEDLSKHSNILKPRPVDYQLPAGVSLHTMYVKLASVQALVKSQPKQTSRRNDKSSLHRDQSSMDLASLRSVLSTQQSLHNYPPSIPTEHNQDMPSTNPLTSRLTPQPQRNVMDPLKMLSKISKNGDFLSDGRPSQSLPGSPRKIRVAANLPDVGCDSPDLRYKVLTQRRPRPGASTHNTPRKVPPGRMRMARKSLGVPSLSPKENDTFDLSKDNKLLDDPSVSIYDQNDLHLNISDNKKNGIDSDAERSFTEINIKNTKNRLNLQFAPDKINRPSDDFDADSLNEDEEKFTREINGNLFKDFSEIKKTFNGNHKLNGKSQPQYLDDDDNSRSEESEISVLELSHFINYKENGDRQLAEATRHSSASEMSDHSSENQLSANNYTDANDADSTKEYSMVTLYTQKLSDSSIHLLLSHKSSMDPHLIYNLWRIVTTGLTEVEAAVVKALEVAEEREGDTFLQNSYSVLTTTDLFALDTLLISSAHKDFVRNPHLMEITLRNEEHVVWCHRHSATETFYQSNGSIRPGLPIPSDLMAKISHRARRSLERDHAITLL